MVNPSSSFSSEKTHQRCSSIKNYITNEFYEIAFPALQILVAGFELLRFLPCVNQPTRFIWIVDLQLFFIVSLLGVT